MSNKKTENEQQEMATAVTPAFVQELLNNGTATLEAPTRDELAEMVNEIPAECTYAVGCVGRKGDGSAYTLRVDLTNK